MVTRIERLSELNTGDLASVCEATEEAITDGLGFDWVRMPSRQVLEAYWRGVLVVPGRELFVARLDGAIVGTCQFVRPTLNNEAGAFNAILTAVFVAPWARGHGLARALLAEVESYARSEGFAMISLDVRETQDAAINLYENAGFVRWGTKAKYAFADGKYIAGYFYTKELGP